MKLGLNFWSGRRLVRTKRYGGTEEVTVKETHVVRGRRETGHVGTNTPIRVEPRYSVEQKWRECCESITGTSIEDRYTRGRDLGVRRL